MIEQVLGKVGLTAEGEWDASKSYERLSVVTHGGSSYVSRKDTSAPLDDAGAWMTVAAHGEKMTYADLTADERAALAQSATDAAARADAATDAARAATKAATDAADAAERIADLIKANADDGRYNGKPFGIAKTYASVAEMEADESGDVSTGEFAAIVSTVEDEDNAKLYLRTAEGWSFVVDMSGATGLTGPEGKPAGFGSVSATVDGGHGTPAVEVSASGPATARNFSFAFHDLQGPRGERGETGATGPTVERMVVYRNSVGQVSGGYCVMADGTQPAITVIERSSKNLLRYGPATGNGLTATVNDDGSLHVSGTATRQYASLSWELDLTALAGKAVSCSTPGLPAGGGISCIVDIYDAAGGVTYLGNGKSATIPADAKLVRLRVYDSRATPAAVDLDLRVQLEYGATVTAWERPDDVSWGGSS